MENIVASPETTDQLIEWYKKSFLKLSFYPFSERDWEVCQCGTEKLIASCRGNANRMRTFLLASSFIDQMIYSHYRQIYSRFRDRYTFPKLVMHGGGGMASSSWVVSPYHGYDKLIDWEAARPIAKILFVDCLAFLQNELGDDYAKSVLLELIEAETRVEVEDQPGQFLREVIAEAVEEINRPVPKDPNNDDGQTTS
jgi:hypothetical protein